LQPDFSARIAWQAQIAPDTCGSCSAPSAARNLAPQEEIVIAWFVRRI